MLIDQRVTIDAPIAEVWDFLMDVPAVGRCMPGVESVTSLDEERYAGTVSVRLGPIGVRLEGTLRVAERDRSVWLARLDVSAADRALDGRVRAAVEMRLEPISDASTSLWVHTDAAVLGKLGQFGQAVMKRQADKMISEFARNMAKAIAR